MVRLEGDVSPNHLHIPMGLVECSWFVAEFVGFDLNRSLAPRYLQFSDLALKVRGKSRVTHMRKRASRPKGWSSRVRWFPKSSAPSAGRGSEGPPPSRAKPAEQEPAKSNPANFITSSEDEDKLPLHHHVQGSRDAESLLPRKRETPFDRFLKILERLNGLPIFLQCSLSKDTGAARSRWGFERMT